MNNRQLYNQGLRAGIRVGSSADDPKFPIYRQTALSHNQPKSPYCWVVLAPHVYGALSEGLDTREEALAKWNHPGNDPKQFTYAVLFDNSDQRMPRRLREWFDEGGSSETLVGADATVSELQAAAKTIAKEHASQHLVVSFLSTKNSAGLNVANIEGFDTAKEAADRYAKLGNQPAGRIYITLFDKTQKDLADNGFLKDEAFFVAMSEVHVHTQITRKTTRQSGAGWVAAGLAAIVGVVALGNRKKGGH